MKTLARAPLFAISSALLFGCAYRVPEAHVPPEIAQVGHLDRMRLDDIDVRAPNRTLDAATVAEVRAETAAILDRASIARGGSPAGRVRVRVELVERRDYASEALQQDGFAIFGLWPVIVGMVSEREKLSVDVTIDDAGRTLEGHGTSEKLGGLYAPARRRALAVALDTALADAAR